MKLTPTMYSAAAFAVLALAGATQAKADSILCSNQAKTGGFGGTVTAFNGSEDATCGAGSGETLFLSNSTSYNKLMWNTAASPNGVSSQALPSGLTLGNLPTVEASVQFTADQSDVSPYFALSFTDLTGSLGQDVATDQILMLEFTNLGLSGAGASTMTLDGNTVFNLYDNTTGHYLQGGQQDTHTLTTWLSAFGGALSGASVDGIWIAEGLAGGCGAGPCTESLSVDHLTLVDPTPEPGTIALLFGGFAGVVALRRRFVR